MTDDPLDQLADQQTAAPDALGAAEKLGALGHRARRHLGPRRTHLRPRP